LDYTLDINLKNYENFQKYAHQWSDDLVKRQLQLYRGVKMVNLYDNRSALYDCKTYEFVAKLEEKNIRYSTIISPMIEELFGGYVHKCPGQPPQLAINYGEIWENYIDFYALKYEDQTFIKVKRVLSYYKENRIIDFGLAVIINSIYCVQRVNGKKIFADDIDLSWIPENFVKAAAKFFDD
jgi:hypothetical protein